MFFSFVFHNLTKTHLQSWSTSCSDHVPCWALDSFAIFVDFNWQFAVLPKVSFNHHVGAQSSGKGLAVTWSAHVQLMVSSCFPYLPPLFWQILLPFQCESNIIQPCSKQFSLLSMLYHLHGVNQTGMKHHFLWSQCPLRLEVWFGHVVLSGGALPPKGGPPLPTFEGTIEQGSRIKDLQHVKEHPLCLVHCGNCKGTAQSLEEKIDLLSSHVVSCHLLSSLLVSCRLLSFLVGSCRLLSALVVSSRLLSSLVSDRAVY